MIKERERTTRARVDRGRVKGVAKERDKVAAKVAHESAGTVVNWVMLLHDLPEDADDCWYEDGEYEVRCLNEVDCEAHSHEDVPRNESPAHAVESDEVHGFDVFARDESLHDDHSISHVNMWDDPDGHVSEGACVDDDRSECSLDELPSTSSLWCDLESIEEASDFESDFSCDEELTPRLYRRAVIEEVPCGPERVEVILDRELIVRSFPFPIKLLVTKTPTLARAFSLMPKGIRSKAESQEFS